MEFLTLDVSENHTPHFRHLSQEFSVFCKFEKVVEFVLENYFGTETFFARNGGNNLLALFTQCVGLKELGLRIKLKKG